MFRNKTASQHNFATVPRADIPRSKFTMRQTRKQAFNASELIPIMLEEVLPGDTWSHKESILARLATPIAPLIDDLDLETFYFFIPNRITWKYWEEFISGTGEGFGRTIPKVVPFDDTDTATVKVGSVFDHFGIPPITYNTDQPRWPSVIPFWAYFTTYNEWFRDQNLQPEWEWDEEWVTLSQKSITTDDGATVWNQMPLRVNKRHDYITSCLPWPQKGPSVQLPLGATAPVIGLGITSPLSQTPGGPAYGTILESNGQSRAYNFGGIVNSPAAAPGDIPLVVQMSDGTLNARPMIYADLAEATSATINAIRLAFQTQRLLERDARGGSRYVEQLLSHFGVRAPDFRLARPEYLGGSKIPITINPIAQTAAYTAEPGLEESALGNLGAEMHASGHKHSFNYAATEHGYILGLACVRATPTYQQGIRRHWFRETRLHHYFPVFSHLGEQPVSIKEIYNDETIDFTEVWGYQEAWAEYRYTPNEITGVLRSTAPQPLDWWHLSEEFANKPTLSAEFITDKTQETLARSLATAPSEQWSTQVIMDILHHSTVARLMPTYSVPGLIDHF